MEIIIGIFLAVILFFIIVMVIDGNRFVVREYTIESDKIKEEQKLVVLADLHNKKYGSNKDSKAPRDLCGALGKPFVCGDTGKISRGQRGMAV